MEEAGIFRAITNLSSNRSKERSCALDELTSTLKQAPDSIPTNLLGQATQVLIELLDSEHRKYSDVSCNSESSNSAKLIQVENRLSSIAYVLRLLIEKTCSRFKVKTLKLLLAILPELMVKEQSKTLLEPISVHLTFSLLALVNSELFRLKIPLHQWIILVDTICTYLEERFKISVTDRNVSNLLTILYNLISIDTIGLYQASLTVHRVVLNYLKLSKRQTVNTRFAIDLVSQLILKTHCLNIMMTRMLIKETWRHIIEIDIVSNESLQDKLCLFDIYASHLIKGTLPTMVGHQEAEVGYFEGYMDAPLCLEYILSRISAYKSSNLSVDQLEFYQNPTKDRSWYKFDHFGLKQPTQSIAWLKLYGITRLLISYFDLIKTNHEQGQILKRRKFEPSIAMILRLSENLDDFLINCIDSVGIEQQPLILQLIAFYTSLQNINATTLALLKEKIFQKFEHTELIQWSCLALISTISQRSTVFSRYDLSRLFKLGIPLLKRQDICPIVSSLLIDGMRYSASPVTDETTLNQIYDLYELSDLNGPCLFCDESLLFWQHLHNYGGEFKFRAGRTAADQVIKWVISKWSQILLVGGDLDNFNLFLGWLANRCRVKRTPKDGKNDATSRKIDQSKTAYLYQYECVSWHSTEEQRDFLLSISPQTIFTKQREELSIASSSTSDKTALNDILYRILALLEPESSLSSIAKLNWIMQGSKLISHLASDSEYLDYVLDFKRVAETAVRTLRFDDKKSYGDFLQLVLSSDFDEIKYLAFHELNIERLMADYKRLFSQENRKIQGRTEFLDEMFVSGEHSDGNLSRGMSSSQNRIELGTALDAFLHIMDYDEQRKPAHVLDTILEFLDDVDSGEILEGIGALLHWMEATHCLWNETSLEHLIQILNEYILQTSHNTSETGIYLLCSFLDGSRKLWLQKLDCPLNVDSNDILDWILLRFEDNSFSSITSIRKLSHLLLNMLWHHDLSRCVKGGKQRIFHAFSLCLKKLDRTMLINDLPKISEYMRTLSHKNQDIIFSEIIALVAMPQQTLELSAFYALSMYKLSQVSFSSLVASLKDSINNAHHAHTRFYILNYLKNLLPALGVSSTRDLFHACRMDIISFWMDKIVHEGGHPEALWDLKLFDLEDMTAFIKSYSAELIALHFSRQQRSPILLEKIRSITKKTESKLFEESFHLILPLSFVSGGIGEELFDISKSLTSIPLDKNPGHIITLRWTLYFIDLGSLLEMKTALEILHTNSSYIHDLFATHHSTSRFQFPLHISMEKGMGIIENRLCALPICQGEVRYLILWILSDMENAKYVAERLRCLRQLKYVLILFENIFPRCNSFFDLLQTLSDYLMDSELHDEVMDLVICLLRVGYVNNLLTTDILSLLFSSILIYIKQYHKDVSRAFQRLSEEITKWNLPHSEVWTFCNKIIQGCTLRGDVYNTDEFINEKLSGSSRILLLSLIFSYSEKFQHFHLQKASSRLSASNLLEFQIPTEHLSANFRLWCAYYIASFENSNKSVGIYKSLGPQFDYDYDKLFDNFGSLEYFFGQFFIFCENNSTNLSPSTKLLCKSLLSFVIYVCGKDGEKMSNIPTSHYEQYIEDCVPMTHETFTKVHELSKNSCGVEEFVDTCFLEETLSYKSWMSKFAIALLNHISFSIPHLYVFSALLEASSIFAETSLPILFNLVIYHDHKKGIEWSANILSKIKRLSKTQEFKKKINLLLKIISMLRSGCMLNERFCLSAYKKLPLHLVCESALLCDREVFAYMIFEEFSMNDPHYFDSNVLSAIYESIGDSDFIAGLGTSHDVAGALLYINKTEPKSWKAFLFNNAKLDAQFNNSSQLELSSLLKSSENHAFYGLSSRLGDGVRASDTNDLYKWALQLGNWNLPVSDNANTREKGLYSTLKKVLINTDSPSRILENSIVDIFSKRKDFSSTEEWLGTLSELGTLCEFTRSLVSMDTTVKATKALHSSDYEKLTLVEFEDYKITLQSRYLLLTLLSTTGFKESCLDAAELKTLAGIELAHFVKLAIDNHAGQDALQKSIVLEYMVKQSSSDNSIAVAPALLERLQTTVSARALWECKDYRTPIKMMKDLLRHDDHKRIKTSDNPMLSLLEVPKEEIESLLVKWASESRIETASSIFEKYIANFTTNIKDSDALANIFNTLGSFLHAQLKKMEDSGEINEWQKRCERNVVESRALDAISSNANLPKNERKDAERHLAKVRVQLHNDMETLTNLSTQKMEFVKKSLLFYMYTLENTNTYDNDVRDKFCGLWFEYDSNDSINTLLKKEIGNVPSWKFLPWVNQIASKLSVDDSEFQKALQLTMKRLLYKLPYDSLYSVLSIKLYGKYKDTSASSIAQKVEAVEKILRDLEGYDRGKYFTQYILPLEEFCKMSVQLATTKLTPAMKDSKKIHLSTLASSNYWLTVLGQRKIPLATVRVNINNASDKKAPRSYIVSVKETVDVSTTGLSLPKIVTFRISDGSTRKVLMKGSNDDLRQDAIMEQVFRQVNNILKDDKQKRKLDLNIETYEVIPLGPRAGIIEFVANSISLNAVLTSLHKTDPISVAEARNEMKKVQTKSNSERLAIYLELTKQIKPQLRNFFFNSFIEPSEWLEAKRSYTKGTAVASIVGHILGLGDRHLNNILLDCRTGKPIHIDLGIAFDQGRFLSIPELIPFRLTRDTVDGFGVTGVEGLFRRSCELTYSVLQKNYEKVMHVLNILKWDPLYSWVMSPVKKHKHLLEEGSNFYGSIGLQVDEARKSDISTEEENQESYRALKGVEEKLVTGRLNVEATVQELIQQASDPRNLSIIFMGWSPFY